jgi:hypothetical protein
MASNVPLESNNESTGSKPPDAIVAPDEEGPPANESVWTLKVAGAVREREMVATLSSCKKLPENENVPHCAAAAQKQAKNRARADALPRGLNIAGHLRWKKPAIK